jgi:hypothetical protein
MAAHGRSDRCRDHLPILNHAITKPTRPMTNMHLHLFWLPLCRVNAFSQGDFYAAYFTADHDRVSRITNSFGLAQVVDIHRCRCRSICSCAAAFRKKSLGFATARLVWDPAPTEYATGTRSRLLRRIRSISHRFRQRSLE